MYMDPVSAPPNIRQFEAMVSNNFGALDSAHGPRPEISLSSFMKYFLLIFAKNIIVTFA